MESVAQRKKGRPMIEILSQCSGKLIAIRLSGKLLHRDYQQLIPIVEKRIEEHGAIRCLIEMTEFHGIEPRALWDEIKFDVRHARQIERCAVIGDRPWEAWMTKFSRLIFSRADIQFFEPADREKAWKWIDQEFSTP
jgi:hypothetical protein